MEVGTDDGLRRLFMTSDYVWSLTYLKPNFEIVGRPTVGLRVVYGAHRTIDGAVKRARAHMDMLKSPARVVGPTRAIRPLGVGKRQEDFEVAPPP